jgi:hypothetical protein
MTDMELRVLLIYAVAVASAYVLKKVTHRMCRKAVAEKKLSTGIYRFFPVEGEKAVRLANGYMRGVKIYFWFMVFIFPFMYFITP